MKKLEHGGVRIQKKKKTSEKLKGMSFVITGTLETMSREAAQDLVRANGGKATNSVSAATTYLVVGENPGSKLQKAEKLGVKVVNEKVFIRLFSSKSGGRSPWKI